MKDEKKNCSNCYYCKALYKKSFDRFVKEKFLLCNKYRKIAEKQESCNYWVYNSEYRKNVKKQMVKEVTMRTIDEMQKNLSEIRQILYED